MTEGPRGYVTIEQLGNLRQEVALLRQAYEFSQRTQSEVDSQARREFERREDALKLRLDRMEERIATIETSIKPLTKAYEGQQEDSRDFNKSIKLALISAVLSIMAISLIGPILQHYLFK